MGLLFRTRGTYTPLLRAPLQLSPAKVDFHISATSFFSCSLEKSYLMSNSFFRKKRGAEHMASMTISAHVISVGNKIIQLRNVSEASIWKDTSHRSLVRWLMFIGFMILLFGLSAYTRDETISLFLRKLYDIGNSLGLSTHSKQTTVNFIASLVGALRQVGTILSRSYPSANVTIFFVAIGFLAVALLVKPKYMLQLQTNAGIITALTSRNRKFMQKVLTKVQYAMSHPDANITFKVNTITNNITDSLIGNMIGGDSFRTSQSSY